MYNICWHLKGYICNDAFMHVWYSRFAIIFDNICSSNTHLAIVTQWTSSHIHSEKINQQRDSAPCETSKGKDWDTEPCSLFCRICRRVGCATTVSDLGHGQHLFPWSLVELRYKTRPCSFLMYKSDKRKSHVLNISNLAWSDMTNTDSIQFSTSVNIIWHNDSFMLWYSTFQK